MIQKLIYHHSPLHLVTQPWFNSLLPQAMASLFSHLPASFKTTSTFKIRFRFISFRIVNSQGIFAWNKWLFLNSQFQNLHSRQVLSHFHGLAGKFQSHISNNLFPPKYLSISNLTYINVNSEFCYPNQLLLLAHFHFLLLGGINIICHTVKQKITTFDLKQVS